MIARCILHNWWLWRGDLVCQDKMVTFSDNQGDISAGSLPRLPLHLPSYRHRRRRPPPPPPPPPPAAAAAAAAALRLDAHIDQYDLIIKRWTSSTAELQASPAALSPEEREMGILLKR